MRIPPGLWFTPAAVSAARQRLAAGDPLCRSILAQARVAAAEPQHPRHIGGLMALAVMDGDGDAASRLADELAGRGPAAQDLGLAHHGMQLAVASACCHELWDATQTARIRAAAAAVIARLRHRTSSHNPHAVQNNWWGVTHSGALLAALFAHGGSDHSEEIRWALGRILAFSQHVGEAGLYHEGLGYQLYTLSHLLPALTAAEAAGLIVLRDRLPWITRLAESLYAFTALRPAVSDSDQPATGFGMMLSWNDAGLAWGSFNVSPLMIAKAEPERRAALGAWYARLEGHLAPGADHSAGWEGWPFALLLPPYTGAGPSIGELRRHVIDHRQGLAVFRDRWQDGDDALLGCYARATHVGGHSQDDGGSLRFMALGHDWIIGGGQARGDAVWQSVVTPRDPAPRKASNGAVIWDEETAAGGVFGMDLRRVSEAYHERYTALAGNGTAGAPAVLAMLDLIDDHRDRAWTWRITYEPGLRCVIDSDGCGFCLIAGDNTQAHCRFLGQRPEAMRHEATPDSARTYSNGASVAYPGRPVIAVDFAAAPHLAIYAVMTVGRGAVPAATLADGVGLRIAGSTWDRPFSVAVPAGYDPLRAGTLARWPDGQRGA